MARIDPQKRPHYPAVERMAILELKAARGWSLTPPTFYEFGIILGIDVS